MHVQVNSFSEGTVGIAKEDKRRAPLDVFELSW